jgi:hypothetical protein
MNATKYINIHRYTDIDSYAVLADDGEHLTVQKVKRDFKPDMVAGGFSAVCANIKEQGAAPVVPDGEAFELIRRKDGTIGAWRDDILFAYPTSSFADGALPGLLAKNANWRLKGDHVFIYAGFKKDGAPKQKFVKFPAPEDTCRAFYDYNF